MDAATMVLLAKIISDLVMILMLSSPATGGMTPEEKAALLKQKQEETNKLVADILAKANA